MHPYHPSRRTVLGYGAAAAALVTAPGAVLAQATGARSSLTVAIQGTPPSLEPVAVVNNVAFRIDYNLYDTLIAVDYKAGFALVPGLATAWRRLSPTVLELDLRPGVPFHNGDILTAEDVAFTFGPERMVAEGAPGYGLTRAFLGGLEMVEATGPLTVRVVTKAPDPLLEKRLAEWASQIICKRAYQAAPSFAAWSRTPVGTGPYKVREFRDGERVVLDAHDGYFRGRPPAASITFKVIPELASRLNALATGEADLITEVAPDQIKTISAMAGREVVGSPILNIRVLVYDKSHPVLADVRVRRALGLAIDRSAIVESLYAGRTRVPHGLQNEAYGPLYAADWPMPATDPAKAKALLQEAGYKGEPIPYRILNDYYTLQRATAEVLLEMWRAVGLNVQLAVVENTNQLLEPSGRGIRDLSNTIFWLDPVGVMSRVYGPRSTIQIQTKEWSNDRFNALCQTLETSLDPAERAAAHRAMLAIYDEIDPPGTVLHDLVMLYGKKASVRWTPYPIEYMDFRPGNLDFGSA